jgi:Carboxypeptidase regulatory-like domain
MAGRYIRRGVLVSIWIVALFCAELANAQTGNAAVAGVVADSAGAVIVGAKVVLRNTLSGDELSVVTGSDGRYTFPTVAPGSYSITASAPSFAQRVVGGIVLELDQHLNEDFALQPGSQSQSVSVTGEVPQVDTTAYDVGGVVADTQIESLPIQNRQYLNLGILVPGTSQGANRTFYNNVQAGSGLYFYANGFYLDGVTNQQTEEGDPRQNIPMGAVSEFKTFTSSMPIELGWAMGGFTAIVTKSGTNQIHGEAFEYYRNTGMTALNQFQQQADALEGTGNPPYTRNQWGGDMGGPVLKNKLHYYGAYDGTEQTSSFTMFVSPSVAADYSAPGLLGTFPSPYHDRLVLGRVDYDIKPNQQLFVRYAQEWNLVTRNGCGSSPTTGTATTIGCYDGQIPRWSYVAGHTWEPNAHMVNDARFQYAYISYELGPWNTPIPSKPSDLVNPSYTQNVSQAFSFPSFGYGHNYAAVGVETRYELNDTYTIIHGKHQIKVGGDVSYVPYIDASASNLNGEWFFKVDEPFSPANPTFATPPYEFTQSATPLLYYLPSNQQAYFAGDTWKIKSTLTVNYGLRWERQIGSAFLDHYTPNSNEPTIPFEGNPHTRGDRRNFGPRLGFTLDPFGKDKDVIRAGFGIYYNFIETELSEAEDLNFVACPITLVTGSPASYVLPYPNPYNGQSVTSFCSTAPPSVTILSPQLRNPYQYQFSAGYSRQLGPNLSLSVDGIYARGLRDYKVYDLNYPLLNGVPTIGVARPFSAFTQILQHASTGASEYKALYVKLEKRMANGRYMYTFSYALSSALDNNPHSAPVSYNTPQNDWGPAGIDQRQAIVGSISYMAPWHIQVGGILTYRSALPFSITTTTATDGASSGKGDPTLPAGTGVLPASALNANGTAQYVPGTKRDQGNRGLNWAAVNLYRQQLNTKNCPNSDPGNSDCATGYPLTTNLNANSMAQTNYLDFDLRLAKSIFHRESMDLQIFGQAFNLFGRENFTAVTTTPTVNTIGVATAAQTVQPTSDVQIGELGARFTF